MNLAFKTILVATDFSEPSRLALEYARVIARRFEAGLRLVHVVETPMPLGTDLPVPEVGRPGERALEEAQHKMAEALGELTDGDVVGQVLVGYAPQKIVDYARDHDVDLIVMGTHGRRALAHFVMGSVAERVVRSAPCPVFTVRDAEALAWARSDRAAATTS